MSNFPVGVIPELMELEASCWAKEALMSGHRRRRPFRYCLAISIGCRLWRAQGNDLPVIPGPSDIGEGVAGSGIKEDGGPALKRRH